MPRPTAHVGVEVELRLVVPDAGKVPVTVDLGYSALDPFAVTAAFRSDGGTIEWVFSRDLLREGLRGPTGEGDVQVWPGEAEGKPVVMVSLSSPDGHAVLEADEPDVRRFLDRTHELVPPGAESRYVDVDDELTDLLGGAV